MQELPSPAPRPYFNPWVLVVLALIAAYGLIIVYTFGP
jgi:hypothetical protein